MDGGSRIQQHRADQHHSLHLSGGGAPLYGNNIALDDLAGEVRRHTLIAKWVAAQGARPVLIDDETGFRAASTAYWFKRQGWDVSLLPHRFD